MIRALLDRLIFSTPLGNILSRGVGLLMRCPLPRFMRPGVYTLFSKSVGLDLSEVEFDLRHYPSLNAFFIRHLKPACRPIHAADMVFPCDGVVTIGEKITQDTLFQAKGVAYSLSELIPGATQSSGSFSTIYLSPKDCHHVFCPADATLTTIHLIPGHLFPVREPYISKHPTLYTRNERMVFTFSIQGGQTLHLVMVGAMNVGAMTTQHAPNLRSNRWGNRAETIHCDIPVQKGDLLGTFHLGSTVVLVSDTSQLSTWQPGPCQRGAV